MAFTPKLLRIKNEDTTWIGQHVIIYVKLLSIIIDEFLLSLIKKNMVNKPRVPFQKFLDHLKEIQIDEQKL